MGHQNFFDQNHQHSQTQTYGTLFYMSPESQLDGDNGIESDVYSFGIILFEILTAHPAYDLTSPELKTTLKLQNKVCLDNYRPQFPFPIKAEFQELIEQCWDPIPYNRPKFTEIYEKLSSDKKYLLNDVDEEEFLVYLDELEEAKNNDFQIQNEEIIAELLAENQILRNENELLKNQTNEEK
ncbi:hypothetical protein TRFO_09816 [Tritrichomonas foetus]|uniref:Protein kinase domain-containing protein n=1 Tax=Tritrichomonas foetus TaxID=1144522 RepID=A0A1J4JEE6_9EUKA|nr:hypothetical protein TRFO_09816 [Tritrichomonas foetus]|eukprot:OHS96663.1 hypothetical protein TRFO_09816 [Tritrichomonas foetus]